MPDPKMLLRGEGGILRAVQSDNAYFGNVFKSLEIDQLGASFARFREEPVEFLSPEIGQTGINTLEVGPENSEPGVVLAEIYDADNSSARLVNLSARALAGRGEDAIMAGFVVAGQNPLPVLIRAIGPTLKSYGIADAIDDPLLQLVNPATGDILLENDDWIASTELTATANRVGAFPLADDSRDAAIMTTLEPGVYVAILSNKADGTAIALIEIYDAS